MSEVLIFLDLETSGLDPYNCEILEIYAKVMTVDQLIANASKVDEDFEFTEELHSVIAHGWLRVIPDDELQGAAWEMHRKSGLLDALKEGGVPNSSALAALKSLFDKYPKAALVGRNVGTFDRYFLECKRPGICKNLSYRNWDISTLRDFAKISGLNSSMSGASHRAKDDVHQDISFLCDLIHELRID